MKDKFILRRATKKGGYKSVNVSVEDYETANQPKEDTGIPLGDILSAMIRFCTERLEVEE